VIPQSWVLGVIGSLGYCQFCIANGYQGVPRYLEHVQGRGQQIGVFPILDGVVSNVGLEVWSHGSNETVNCGISERKGVVYRVGGTHY